LTATLDQPPTNWRSVYAEYQVGGYGRRFTLGNQVDQSKINASMENGVLTLVLPKAEAVKPRKIAIR
jgi:HSP20 family molecular chaperone IbpA